MFLLFETLMKYKSQTPGIEGCFDEITRHCRQPATIFDAFSLSRIPSLAACLHLNPIPIAKVEV